LATANPASGWPDSTNTGVPAGVTLLPSGSIIVTKPGTVISGLDIRGTVYIAAPNVTLENCRIVSDSYHAVQIVDGITGTLVQDCEINGGGNGLNGILGSGTFLRNNIYNVENGITLNGSNTVIEGNYIHDLNSTGDPHYDGIVIGGTISNVKVHHNTVIINHDQTAAIMIANERNGDAPSNISVDNNLLVGGGYTVYADAQFGSGQLTGISFTNNHMGPGHWGVSAFTKSNPVYVGNVNDGAALARLLNTSGNVGGDSPTPQDPTGSPIIASFSTDSGIVGDKITNDNTLTLTGTAAPRSVIKIFDADKQIGAVVADSKGAWSFTSATLPDGAHKFTATATISGATSPASAALSVTIDTAAPNAPTLTVSTSAAALAASKVAVLTGSAEAGSTVKVYDGTTQIGTATAGGNGAWTFTTGTLTTGNHNFTAKATDAAGNTGGASSAVPVTISNSTTPPPTKPDAPVITSFSEDSGVKGDGITNDNTIALTGTAAANSTIKIYDGSTQIGTATAAANGSWSYITSVLTDAKHTLTATVTNGAGQTSSASSAVAITVDTKAPDAPSIGAGAAAAARAAASASTSIPSGTPVNLTGVAEAKSSVAIYDGNTKIGTVTAGTDGSWSFSTGSLSAGQHVLTAKATDVAGNVGAASAALTVNVTSTTPVPPTAPKIVSFSNDTGKTGDGITSDNTLKLAGTAAASSTVTVYDGMQKIGTVQSDSNGAWSFNTAVLRDGSHNFTAKVTDSKGQTGAVSDVTKVIVDTKAPGAPSLGVFTDDGKALSGQTKIADVVLKGTAEANSQIKLYDAGKLIGETTTKGDGTWSFDPGHLSNGGHKFSAIASDVAGNASAASAAKAISVIDAPSHGTGIDLTQVYQIGSNIAVIKGTADAYSQIKIFDGAKEIGSVKANGNGDWWYGTGAVSSNYVHTFSAKELDKSGQVVSSSGNVILGTAGANTLKGTSGDDIFVGNGHADTFVFAPNFGNDTIKDFGAKGSLHDVVQFSKSMFDNFADVLAHATQSGQDVVISSGNDSLTLKNTKLSALDKSDFHFT